MVLILKQLKQLLPKRRESNALRITRASLAVAGAASTDKKEPAINRVHLAKDGTTVASNGAMILAVGPPDHTRMDAFPSTDHSEPDLPADGVGISIQTVADIRRNLPTEKRMALQQAAVTRCDTKVDLLITDGAQEKTLSVAPMRGKFPKWKEMLAQARKKATVARVCVSRRDLMKMLRAIDEACPDRGAFNPVFIEIGERDDELILRSQNYETKQRVVGMMTSIKIKGDGWLPEDDWERGVFGGGKPKITVKRKVKITRKEK